MATSIYDFAVTAIDGQKIELSQFRDKVLLIVNTASRCGFTRQYAELEDLYQRFADDGLVILAFPCNQFANQEPGTEEQISEFCSLNFGVTFPLMRKINVNGENADPLFKFLKSEARGILGTSAIKWNFTKFLIGKEASTIVRFSPLVSPRKLIYGIQSLLEE